MTVIKNGLAYAYSYENLSKLTSYFMIQTSRVLYALPIMARLK
jgi:hypothetical protein